MLVHGISLAFTCPWGDMCLYQMYMYVCVHTVCRLQTMILQVLMCHSGHTQDTEPKASCCQKIIGHQNGDRPSSVYADDCGWPHQYHRMWVTCTRHTAQQANMDRYSCASYKFLFIVYSNLKNISQIGMTQDFESQW